MKGNNEILSSFDTSKIYQNEELFDCKLLTSFMNKFYDFMIKQDKVYNTIFSPIRIEIENRCKLCKLMNNNYFSIPISKFNNSLVVNITSNINYYLYSIRCVHIKSYKIILPNYLVIVNDDLKDLESENEICINSTTYSLVYFITPDFFHNISEIDTIIAKVGQKLVFKDVYVLIYERE